MCEGRHKFRDYLGSVCTPRCPRFNRCLVYLRNIYNTITRVVEKTKVKNTYLLIDACVVCVCVVCVCVCGYARARVRIYLKHVVTYTEVEDDRTGRSATTSATAKVLTVAKTCAV